MKINIEIQENCHSTKENSKGQTAIYKGSAPEDLLLGEMKEEIKSDATIDPGFFCTINGEPVNSGNWEPIEEVESQKGVLYTVEDDKENTNMPSMESADKILNKERFISALKAGYSVRFDRFDRINRLIHVFYCLNCANKHAKDIFVFSDTLPPFGDYYTIAKPEYVDSIRELNSIASASIINYFNEDDGQYINNICIKATESFSSAYDDGKKIYILDIKSVNEKNLMPFIDIKYFYEPK